MVILSPLSLSCVLFTVTLILHFLFKHSSKQHVLPAGPRGIPVLGNAHQIASKAPIQFSKWALKYGKMYTINLGGKPALVVNDAALIRQLFGMSASTKLLSSQMVNLMFEGGFAALAYHGSSWLEQRHFCAKTLRNCGLSKSSGLECLVLAELEQMCEEIKKEMNSQGRVHLSKISKITANNVLYAILTGERKLTKMAQLFEQFQRCLERVANSGLAFYPWIKYVAPEMSGYTEYLRACQDLRQFLWKCFEEREKKGSYEEPGWISMFLKKVQDTTEKESSFHGREGLRQAFNSVLGMLIAGSESTSSMTNWIIFYLSVHPNVQEKVKREIDDCVGKREPALEDRSRMPYTEAVIEESLRFASVLPYGVPHELLEDVSFHDFKLPQGMMLIANIYHAHHDPNVWKDPEVFRPERFLNNENHSAQEGICRDRFNLRDKMVTFLPGKRACLGEALGRDVLFLSVAKLVQTFLFCGVKGVKKEEYMEPDIGVMMFPRNVPVVALVNK